MMGHLTCTMTGASKDMLDKLLKHRSEVAVVAFPRSVRAHILSNKQITHGGFNLSTLWLVMGAFLHKFNVYYIGNYII